MQKTVGWHFLEQERFDFVQALLRENPGKGTLKNKPKIYFLVDIHKELFYLLFHDFLPPKIFLA